MAFMLPSDDASAPGSSRPAPTTAAERARPTEAAGGAGAASPTPSHRRPLTPIGPDRLRRLRQSILNGTYPLDEAVVGGLARMFMGSAPAGRRRGDG